MTDPATLIEQIRAMPDPALLAAYQGTSGEPGDPEADALWIAAPQDDLQAALAEFREALPGWWYSVGECHVSADASCGPDSAGNDAALLKDPLFDNGFHADLDPPATMADALRDVTAQALAQLASQQPPSNPRSTPPPTPAAEAG